MSLRRRFRSLLLESLAQRLNFASIYYIDPQAGNDSHSGLSPQEAYRSPAKLVSQYASLQPAGHVDLAPGDTVVLMPGVHNYSYLYGEGQWQGLFFRDIHGTADNPITVRGMPGAEVRNTAPDGTEMSAIYVLQSSFVNIENLDVSGYGSPVAVAESQHIAIRDNYIHDADGLAYNNLSGLYLTGNRDVWVEDNFFADNYDRQRIGNQNNRHIVVFGSIDTHIIGNTMINQNPTAGMGVDYKHLGGLTAAETGVYEVAYNTIVNANGVGIGSAAPNSHLHHNILVNSGEIRLADFGGTNQLANELVEYNTIVNTGVAPVAGGLEYNPNEYPGYPLGKVTWRNNIVVDKRNYGHSDSSTVVIDRYGGDEFYRRVIEGGLFEADGNLYQTQEPARFDIYGANHGNYGSLGERSSFEQWQTRGYDRHGAVTDVALDEFFASDVGSQAMAGVYANTPQRIVAVLERNDIDESGASSTAGLRLTRSGPLDEETLVKLESSRPGQLKLPASVSFPRGVAEVEVAISGVSDSEVEPTEAIAIKASVDGGPGVTVWLRLHDAPGTANERVSGVFQVPGVAGTNMRLESHVLTRWAEYDNEMGVAYVDDESGRVGNLLPGDAGWTRALMTRNQNQVVLASGATEGDSGSITVPAGQYFVFTLVQDASTRQWLSLNPDNQFTNQPWLFTSIQSSNPDQFDHVHESQTAEGIELAWEDLAYGGDLSFRDLIVSNQFKAAPTFCTAVDNPIVSDPVVDVPPTPSHDGSQVRHWTNPDNPADVNGDGTISALDALQVINILNEYQQVVIEDLATDEQDNWPMADVNADGKVTAMDALLVIIELL